MAMYVPQESKQAVIVRCIKLVLRFFPGAPILSDTYGLGFRIGLPSEVAPACLYLIGKLLPTFDPHLIRSDGRVTWIRYDFRENNRAGNLRNRPVESLPSFESGLLIVARGKESVL